MKAKLLFSVLLTVLIVPQITLAQFNILSTNYGQTTTLMRGIGIGNFGGNGALTTNARLHVSNFYCNQPNGPLSGFLFRTDGRNNVANMWQMFTGNNANNVTEKFRLFVPANSNNVVMQAQQSGANILFNTTTSFFGTSTKMVITDGLLGYVGIGNNFLSPKSQLHLNDGAFDTYTQITNNATGANATDGLRIGILGADGSAIINQQETGYATI